MFGSHPMQDYAGGELVQLVPAHGYAQHESAEEESDYRVEGWGEEGGELAKMVA